MSFFTATAVRLQEEIVTLVPELVISGIGQIIVVVVALFVHYFVAMPVGSEVEFAVAPIDWHAALDCRLPPAFVPSFDDVVYFVESIVQSRPVVDRLACE